MTEGFISALQQHNWKGNVRELRNVLERALIINDGDSLLPEDLPFGEKSAYGDYNPDSLLLSDMERLHIGRVLARTDGNKTEAAKLMGIGLTTLYRKIEEYNISI
jgi:two-component system NtrC family response regulator